MNLQQLATDLRGAVKDGKLTLDNTIIKQDSFAFVLGYFDGQKIALSGLTNPPAQITVSGSTLTIAGTQTLYGLAQPVQIALLQTATDTLQSKYTTAFTNLGFSKLASWNIIPAGFFDPAILPALPFQAVTMAIASELGYQQWAAATSANEWTLVPAISLKIKTIGFGIQRTLNPLAGGYDTSFWLTGTFLLGKQTNLTVSVAAPVSASAPAGQWRLNLASSATLADGITDLSQLVFGNNLFATLPPGFQQATRFRLDQLLLTFSLSGGGTVNYAKLMVGRPADQPWTIVDGFTVTDAGANFTLNKATNRYTVATYLFAKFAIGGGGGTPAKAYLNVTLDVPAGSSDWVAHLDGSLENTNGIDDLFGSLPASKGYSLPAFPVGLQLQEINLQGLDIAFNPASKTLSSIQLNVTSVLEFDIFGLLSVRDPYVALDIRNPTLSKQRTLTGTIGGTLDISGVSLDVVADKPAADAGWTFAAGMRPGSVIPLLGLVKKFLKPLGIETLPDWVNKASLNISGVAVSMYVPTATSTDQRKKYHVEGTVKWKIDVNSFALPKALDATVSLDYVNGKASGSITVVATLLLPFKLGYKFGTPATEVYLEWLGIQADYQHNSTTLVDVITLTFANMSVGEIITHLIQSFDPGFALSPPWDVLNSINLSGLALKYTNDKNTPANSKIEIVYAKAINLGFLQLDQVTITKDKTGVFLGFKGKFLGVEISSTAPDPAAQKLAGKGADVRDLDSIPVPGLGTQFFDLDYLGMGQRVALYPFKDLKTVDQAISSLKGVFLPPAPPVPGKAPILPIKATPKRPSPSATLVFSEESSWLIATKFTIIEAITLGVVFNDPNLYGLLVKLDGEKMQALNGLSFQILYKKVTDSVGVYQIELKLPDSIRELQFGAVSVTLPVIGIDVYTNGSFRLDFGFPANMDFSKSLTVQAFPFTGSGGFYIAYLHDVPSDKVPKTTRGIFNPVVEFGLGLQLGIGKSINKGILKAGFSVTVIGIFEGVIAFFKSNSGTPAGSGDTYYKVSATVGLVGKLYGEVSFAIISASVDITVYAYVQMVVEAYRKIPIYLEAGVSVSLRVSVNLGLFKIHINLHFSTTISASFTIGSDSQAPWDLPATTQRRLPATSLLRGTAAPAVVLTWNPLVLTAQEQASERLSLYFFPQLTVARDSASTAVQLCNLLYIDAPQSGSAPDASLNRLVKGVLYWCINAAVNSGKSGITLAALKGDTVSYDALKQLHAYLSDTSTNPSPIPYANIEAFLQAYFTIAIADTNQAAAHQVGTGEPLNASIFPIFPMLQVSWALNGTRHALSTYTADSAYMTAVQQALRKLRVDYQNPAEMAQDKQQETGHGVRSAAPQPASDQALSTLIFQDYILLLARSAVQDAVNELEKFAAPFGSTDSLATIAAAYNELTYSHGEDIDTNDVTVAGLAAANSSLLFRQGLSLEIPSVSHQVRAGDTLQRVADQYRVPVPALATGGNTAIQGLVPAGLVVQVAGFDEYRIGVGQTLDQVAASMASASGKTHPTIEQVLQAVKDHPLLSLARLVLPTLAHTTGAADSFESVALLYGVSVATLAGNAPNAKQPGLFGAGVTTLTIPSLQVLGVGTLVDTFDTSDNIARISGMAARYFLHGMRLPVPGQLASTAPLYGLSGQQFPLPALKAGDALSVRLGKTGDTTEPCFLQLNGSCATTSLDIPLTDAVISRINSLATVPFDPGATPLPLPLGKTTGQTFTLKPGISWQYPGTLALPVGTPPAQLAMRPSVWAFSEALMNQLEALQATDLGLSVQKLVRQSEQGGFDKQAVYNGFATLLDFSIQQVQGLAGAQASANVYEIIGAGDTSIVLLERLIRHINQNNGDDSFIDQIRVLYPADPTSDAPVGLQSAVDGGVTIGLVQANLSTETNPASAMLFRRQAAAPRNTLNEFKQFVSFLWQGSIVRTGGYFLYYKTADGAGLPPSLFSQGKTVTVQLLITYRENLSAAFVNSVAIGEPIDSATTTVHVEATRLHTLVAVASPGNAGFELERTKPDEYVPLNPYPIPADAGSKHQDLNYLNYQFNLVGYALLESDVFEGAYSLLPVGPTHDPAAGGAGAARLAALPHRSLADENWKYNALIPLAKNVKPNKRIQPAKPGYPAAANDPYAGIGSTAQVRLSWQDMFGNTYQTPLSDGNHDLSLSCLYTDPLFALAQWPSVSSYYYFGTKAGTPQLHVDFFASAARYTASAKLTRAEAIRNARIDQVTIQKIYYQLIQAGITIQVQSSLSVEAGQPAFDLDPKVLAGFAGELYAYLSAVIADPLTATLPAPLKLAYDIDLKNSNFIFELTVVLTLQRTQHIEPAFAGVAQVSTVANILSPVLKAPPTASASAPPDDMLSLAGFAQDFEAAFKDRPAAGNFLKVATGLDRTHLGNTSDKKLWVVHFDATAQHGIWYTIDNTQQYFFAPKPLANNLETFDKVPVYSYKTGEPYPSGSPALTTFSDIDLDNWGRLCLDAIDLLLTATYATPAFLVDNGTTLQTILAAKEQIAEGIAASVAPILQAAAPDLSGLANAQEKLKQQVLIQLSNAYKISTVVQNAVQVTKGFAGQNEPVTNPPFVPQLYGNMVSVLQEAVRSRHAVGEGPDQPSDDYTLSTAKVPLGTGLSWLTYLFEAKEADKHSSFNFANMAFRVSYIEHQIASVAHMGDYRASSWLTLLLPLDLAMSDIGPVDIPIALRSYPTPPSLVSQEIDYQAARSTAPTMTIPEALQWGYAFSYQPPLAGQDQIQATLQFNYSNHPDQAKTVFYQGGGYDATLLPATLGQFVTVYPAIQKDFQQVLLRNPADPAAAMALRAFSTLVTNIGTAWKQWEEVKMRARAVRQSNPLPTYSYDYDVIEAPEAGVAVDPKLTIRVKPRGGAPELTVSLLDYLPGPNNTFYKKVGTKETYLLYDERKAVPLRTLSLGKRNILDMQNAWSGVLLTRNEDLVKNKDGTYRTTQPEFIYKTPLVKFYNELVPLLVCGKPIEVAQIDTPGKPKVLNLAKHLQNLFKTLLATSNPEQTIFEQTIKVECRYTYNLVGTDAFNQITLPVLLATPLVFTLGKDWEIGSPGAYCAGTDSFVCNLTQVMLNWFAVNNPLVNNGCFQFAIEVYSQSNNKLPILNLSNILLEVPYIKEMAKPASGKTGRRKPSSR